MKVLHVLGALRRSGAEQMLLCTSAYQMSRGIDQQVMSLAAPSESVLAGRFQSVGFEVEHLPVSSRFRFPLEFWRELKLMGPDCVHIHAERLSLITQLCGRLAGKPVVRTIHATFEFKGLLRYRKTLERKISALAGVQFVAISRSVQANEELRFRTKPALIENWFDDQFFRLPTEAERRNARRDLDLHDGETAIALVGNCAQVKNHVLLFDALAQLDQPPFTVLHVGDDSDESAAPSERLAASRASNTHTVRFLGPRDDVREILWASDLYVMCSLAEGAGIAAMEAAATGIRCILTDVPGLRDLSGVIGAEPGIPLEKTLLASALSSQAPWDRSGEQGADQAAAVKARHGAQRGAEEYAGLYYARLTRGRRKG